MQVLPFRQHVVEKLHMDTTTKTSKFVQVKFFASKIKEGASIYYNYNFNVLIALIK